MSKCLPNYPQLVRKTGNIGSRSRCTEVPTFLNKGILRPTRGASRTRVNRVIKYSVDQNIFKGGKSNADVPERGGIVEYYGRILMETNVTPATLPPLRICQSFARDHSVLLTPRRSRSHSSYPEQQPAAEELCCLSRIHGKFKGTFRTS